MKHEGDDSPLFACQHCQHVPAAAGSLWHRQLSRGGGGTVAAAGPAATTTPAARAEQGCLAPIPSHSNPFVNFFLVPRLGLGSPFVGTVS